jgi:hypothetical protein
MLLKMLKIKPSWAYALSTPAEDVDLLTEVPRRKFLKSCGECCLLVFPKCAASNKLAFITLLLLLLLLLLASSSSSSSLLLLLLLLFTQMCIFPIGFCALTWWWPFKRPKHVVTGFISNKRISVHWRKILYLFCILSFTISYFISPILNRR